MIVAVNRFLILAVALETIQKNNDLEQIIKHSGKIPWRRF